MPQDLGRRFAYITQLVAALIALASPCLLAQQAAPSPAPQVAPAAAPLAYDVVSIRPARSGTSADSRGIITERTGIRTTADGASFENANLKALIANAYNVKDNAIVDVPDWADSAHYDIDAKVVPDPGAPPPALTTPQRRQMLQSLLADRFHLVVHRDTKDAPIYELDLAKGGSKLHQSTPTDAPAPNGHPSPVGFPMMFGPGKVSGQSISISSLTDLLTAQLHRPVVNKTGLTGKYDLNLQWTPDWADADAPDVSGPSLFTAVEEQLGLKLTASHGPVTTLVIDRIERPTPN
jgi:uncharacterized protein (TIGR03435 family)